MRVVIAEDAALLQAGLTWMLTDHGHEVCAAVGDGPSVLAAVASTGRTRRSSTSGCRPRTPTKGSARP